MSRDRLIVALFTITAFLGAALLFVVEPLVAKLLLPSYGGSATVWSTTTLFFQVLLLAAYGYAHISTTRLGRTWQPRVHLVVLALPLLALPLTLPSDATPPEGASPALWLLRTLLVLVGLPFVVVGTTGPLLQRWYSWSGAPRADDPYFLFAASNLGSFGGLLLYPFLIEPLAPLAEQRSWWSAAYLLFLLLTAGCGAVAMLRRKLQVRPDLPADVETAQALAPRRVLVWILLAFVPSSLMLGVTAHISTDIAAIPLLWVVPLAIYLASFVLAFARRSRRLPVWAMRAAAVLAVLSVLTLLLGTRLPIQVAITVDLAMLAVVSYAAHVRLAVDRPGVARLTTFYMVVAAGGALGGLLNGLLAPLVLNRLIEYPAVLFAVPLLALGLSNHGGVGLRETLTRRSGRIGVAVVVLVLLVSALAALIPERASFVVLTLPAMVALGGLAWLMSWRPAALAGLAVLLFVGTSVLTSAPGLAQVRTFYGTYRVEDVAGLHTLKHGTTVHGTQFETGPGRDAPTTYYSRQGPLGDIFRVLNERGLENVAAVGLGAGTLASYGRPGQRFTFYEIDPAVVRLAEDPRLFTYVADSPARVQMALGDGRKQLERAPASSYDLIILDAFSSDAIPVHLLTTEAMRLYADRLRPGGVIAVHISNRVFDLRPVLAADAEDLGWSAVQRMGDGRGRGAVPAQWVVLGRQGSAVGALAAAGWTAVDPSRQVRWTDDYSSVLSVLR